MASKQSKKAPKGDASRDKRFEGFEVSEEAVKVKKPRKERDLPNWILWVLFVAVFLGFLAMLFLSKAPPAGTTTVINGINITAPGDNPASFIRNMGDMHITGKTIDNSTDAKNALQEIGAVIGQSRMATYGGSHTLFTGVTKKTAITITKDMTTIEGATKADLWKAVWTFTSLLSDTKIESSIDLYDVQGSFRGVGAAYLVDVADSQCSSQFGRMISAEGDILSSLGFQQAAANFDIYQVQKDGDTCKLMNEFLSNGSTVSGLVRNNATNVTDFRPIDCPTESGLTYVILIKRGESNQISVDENGIVLQYSACDTVDRISVIVRDLIYPNIVSQMAEVQFPTSLDSL